MSAYDQAAWTMLREARTALEAAHPTARPHMDRLELALRLRRDPADPPAIAALGAMPRPAQRDVLELVSANVPPQPEIAAIARDAVELPDPDARDTPGAPPVGLFARRLMAVWAGVDARASGFRAMAALDRMRGLGRLVGAGWPLGDGTRVGGLDALVRFASALGEDELGAAVMAWMGERGFTGHADEIAAIDRIARPGLRLEAIEVAMLRGEVDAELAGRWLTTADEARARVDDATGRIVVRARRLALEALTGRAVTRDLEALSAEVVHERDPFFVAAVWRTLARAAAVIGPESWEIVTARMARETRGLKDVSAWRAAQAEVVRALPRLARSGGLDRGREALVVMLGRPADPWLLLLLEVVATEHVARLPGRSVEAQLTAIEARLRAGVPAPVPWVSVEDVARGIAHVDPARALRIGAALPVPMQRVLWAAALITDDARGAGADMC